MADALQKLAEEDPTFQVRVDENTGQTLISGMGELHLEVLVDRMLREFKVEANVGRPQVAYRETITRPARAQGRFVRQSGGRGQYGDVVWKLSRWPRGRVLNLKTRLWVVQFPRNIFQPLNKVCVRLSTGSFGWLSNG